METLYLGTQSENGCLYLNVRVDYCSTQVPTVSPRFQSDQARLRPWPRSETQTASKPFNSRKFLYSRVDYYSNQEVSLQASSLSSNCPS